MVVYINFNLALLRMISKYRALVLMFIIHSLIEGKII